MFRLSTLPGTREQARHALLLLGAPAPARLVVDVHRALFDGDLAMPALAGLLRAEQRATSAVVCRGLTADLAPIHLALAEWPLDRRIVTPATARADLFTGLARIAEFIAIRSGASRSADRLLRSLAAEAGQRDDPELDAAIEAETPIRESAVARAARLDQAQRLFGVPAVPRQRCGE